MTGNDPFAVLGLSEEATLDEIRAARRHLAFAAHPDRGGDPALMTAINTAFDAAVRLYRERRAAPRDPVPPSSPPPSPPPSSSASRTRQRRNRWSLEHDVPSFTIGVLPAEAFEALMVVASWIGEVLVDDPPYLLDVHLHEPAPCWCRLELLPDAGATTVNLMVGAVDAEPAPTAEEVRDTWVANLNRL